MPHWGKALALGRNLNDSMPRERELQALASLDQARERRANGNEREQALIDALASRYSTDEDADRADVRRGVGRCQRGGREAVPGRPGSGHAARRGDHEHDALGLLERRRAAAWQPWKRRNSSSG